jgi:hypothetical protein
MNGNGYPNGRIGKHNKGFSVIYSKDVDSQFLSLEQRITASWGR